ncbi:MAG: type II toxin-antitoxin system HicA family toxin [Enterococcus hulanensis]
MLLTGKEMLKLAKKHGWLMVRINGSHHIMIKEGHLPDSIPVHNKDLKIGTEQKILKDLG